MDTRKYLSLLAVTLFMLLTLYGTTTEACSCMPRHAQTTFCEADYVTLLRVVRKSHRLLANNIVYKVEIKKSYKLNEAGHKMLRHGRIVTSESDSMCGVNLEIGKLYMVAGKAPNLSICNSYVREYTKMSVVERRGMTGVYRKGCKCQIEPCFGNQCLSQRETRYGCKWSPRNTCESDFSACMPMHYRTPDGFYRKCHWQRTPAYKACITNP